MGTFVSHASENIRLSVRAAVSSQRGKSKLPPRIAAWACALFGVLLVLNVHPIGDGVWFWYASALRHGERLYSGLHLPMQPLFVYLTAWNQRILGQSWLASKALAVVQDALYCWAVYRIARRVALPPVGQALLIVAAFGTNLVAIYYRFDDYHITCQVLALFAIDLLLQLREESRTNRLLWSAAALGLCAGLATGTRLNDGALLALTTGVVLAVFARRQRWTALIVFGGVTGTVLLLVVLMTGDSLTAWANETIFRAAAIKGGTGSVVSGPVRFPFTALRLLFGNRSEFLLLVGVYASVALFPYGNRVLRTQPHRRRVGFALVTLSALLALAQLRNPRTVAQMVSISLITGVYALAITLLVFRVRRWRHRAPDQGSSNRGEALFLIPFGQLCAGAMTSGQSPLEAYPTIAMMLLVVPFVFPALVRRRILRDGWIALLAILAVSTLLMKWALPYTWHHYYQQPLFMDRTWYDHPQYGPMYLERSQLRLMQDVCGTIQSQGEPAPELLAVPWPYPNYFCHIAPWRGYVQTWYDTTSPARMDSLVHDLQQHPPEWIAYERGLDTMNAHEWFFLHGGKLPHRKLDALVVERLQSGAWSLPLQRCYGGVDWLLIRTRPAAAGELSETLLGSTNRLNLCSRTAHGYLP